LKERLANNKGNTLIELIMVMMLLALFGVTMFTLIYAGSRAQETLGENKRAQIDARIGLNYVNVKLRQNDVADRVIVAPHPETSENAIVIREPEYDTWIYFHDGALYEFWGIRDDLPDLDRSNLIVRAADFRVTYDKTTGTLTNTIVYTYNGQSEREMTSTIHLQAREKQ